MVGGWIIQIMPIGPDVTELWCVDRDGDETAVKVKTELQMPMLGEEIWWQDGKVYFDNDRKILTKVGNSYAKE